jgi:hypothetical protein
MCRGKHYSNEETIKKTQKTAKNRSKSRFLVLLDKTIKKQKRCGKSASKKSFLGSSR